MLADCSLSGFSRLMQVSFSPPPPRIPSDDAQFSVILRVLVLLIYELDEPEFFFKS
jgi:hypothetical protein